VDAARAEYRAVAVSGQLPPASKLPGSSRAIINPVLVPANALVTAAPCATVTVRQRLGKFMLRKTLLFLLIACLGCSAAPQQAKSGLAGDSVQSGAADLNRRVERAVRSEYKIPAYVQISISSPKPSEFANYDDITVSFATEERKQSHEFLISKDGKQLIDMRKIDLTVDPYQKAMSKIDLAGRPLRGNPDAKVTVVVYDDYQCPFCSRMHQEMLSLMKSYGDRIKVYYKDFPLFEIHPWAGRAAIDSNCLARQNGAAFWDFADSVHANGRQISGEKRPLPEQLAAVDHIATDIGGKHKLNAAALAQCIKEQPAKDLDSSVKEAESLGVNATPYIFVNGQKVEGAVPEPELKAILDQALRDAGQQPPPATSASAAGSGK
jgi:protein-disulfide isomerase